MSSTAHKIFSDDKLTGKAFTKAFNRLMLSRWQELRKDITGRPIVHETEDRHNIRLAECSNAIADFTQRLA